MDKFQSIISRENLVIPNYDEPNIVDLVRLLYNYCGMNYKENKNIQLLKKYISNKKHLVLILVDGMGSDLLNKMPEKGLFYDMRKKDIQTVFPTATGCVLTSLATARYPSSTGIFGWYGYNRKLNLNYYTLLTKDRISNEDLNIDLKKVFKYKSVLNSLKRDVNVIQPNELLNSRYTRYCFSSTRLNGYNNYEEAINFIKEDIKTNNDTLTYLYIPFVDTLEHKYGPYNELVYSEIAKIERSIGQLLPLNNDVEMVVISDHGQTLINDVIYMDLNKYDKFFYAYPSIDAGTSTFFVKEGMKRQFKREFKKDFGDKVFLFTKKEFIDKKMFGKRMSKYAIDCLGEYVSVCRRNVMFYSDYHEIDNLPMGNHTGLSREELMIPLIVIRK